MIAIPNMEKPKECEECLFFMLDGVITDDNEWISYSVCDLLGKTIGDADMLNDCPLIEIPQEDEKAVLFLLRMRKATREGKSWREFLDEERRTYERTIE